MTKTGVFVVVIAIIVAIWDMIAVLRGGVESSVSKFLQTVGCKSPTFCVCLGILIGHFFAVMR